jgi:hypothetical protein
MVRKTGFDPVASCTPSTRSAWLSYVLMKWGRATDAADEQGCDREVYAW